MTHANSERNSRNAFPHFSPKSPVRMKVLRKHGGSMTNLFHAREDAAVSACGDKIADTRILLAGETCAASRSELRKRRGPTVSIADADLSDESRTCRRPAAACIARHGQRWRCFGDSEDFCSSRIF